MKSYQCIHAVALFSLLVVAGLNLTGQIHRTVVFPAIYYSSLILGFASWALLLWKIYQRPKQWGLGVGIFLILVCTFQIYLWHKAMSRPDHIGLGVYAKTSTFVWYETPLLVAGVCCLLLRGVYPLPLNVLPQKLDRHPS